MKNVNQSHLFFIIFNYLFLNVAEFELKQAMEASACLIKYLSLLSDENNFKQFKLTHHDLSQYMRLDASALSALNLMPNQQLGSNKTMSLYGLLNTCNTAQGGRLLSQWLKQPLLDIKEISKRQDLVQIFFQDTELRQSLQENHLKKIPDLHRIAKRFQRGIANLQVKKEKEKKKEIMIIVVKINNNIYIYDFSGYLSCISSGYSITYNG